MLQQSLDNFFVLKTKPVSYNFVIDEKSYQPFSKIISLSDIKYFLFEKHLGTFNKSRKYYITFRRKYAKLLSNQKMYPNWKRIECAKELGLNQKFGHFFDKFQSYGISNKVFENRTNEDLFIIVEHLVEEDKIQFLVCPFDLINNFKKKEQHQWVDNSNGINDKQTLIHISNFEIKGTFDRKLQLEVR